jgi:hypothetical protein
MLVVESRDGGRWLAAVVDRDLRAGALIAFQKNKKRCAQVSVAAQSDGSTREVVYAIADRAWRRAQLSNSCFVMFPELCDWPGICTGRGSCL